MKNTDLLHKPVAQLPVSEHFKEVMGEQGIKTLDDIVRIPVTDLANTKWFTNEVLMELSELLLQNKKETKRIRVEK